MSASLEKIKDTIMLRINETEMRVRMHAIVFDVLLKKFNGKKLTKRLETAIKERLAPNAMVSYTVGGYGFKHGELEIWAVNGFEYSNAFTCRLGSNEELEAYNPEGYNDNNNIDSSKAYVEMLWSLLNDDSNLRYMCDIADECKNAWDRLYNISSNSALDAVRFDLQRLTGLQVSHHLK